jgi:membrane dipeptidase
MGITGVRHFVKTTEPTTLEDMLDHYDHVRRLVGVQHVGLGSDIDLDGNDDLPLEQQQALRNMSPLYASRAKFDIEGVDHPKRVFDLTEGLIRRGYSDTDIRLVLGDNFRRVLKEIWTV